MDRLPRRARLVGWAPDVLPGGRPGPGNLGVRARVPATLTRQDSDPLPVGGGSFFVAPVPGKLHGRPGHQKFLGVG